MLENLVHQNRSFRRFYENEEIDISLLKSFIELSRFTPSGANLQPLKYILSTHIKTNSLIFPNLSWAGYLKDFSGPLKSERPSAYIIILGDKTITKSFGCDPGIVAQTILLAAVEKGLGGCMIGSINRDKLRSDLNISNNFDILLVLALGKPKQKVVIDTASKGKSIKYWRDEQNIHHVPKRSTDELILCSHL